jgi:hypothetical protein
MEKSSKNKGGTFNYRTKILWFLEKGIPHAMKLPLVLDN